MRSLKAFFVGSFFLAALAVSARPAAAQGVGFGFEGGITRSSLQGDSVGDFVDGRTGWLGGIWFGGNRGGRVGFMGELVYIEKGASANDDDLKLRYLEIPALFRVNIGSRNKNSWTVYPLFGPVFDIKLGAKLNDLDVSDDYNGFDVGAMAGVGVEAFRVGVEVRGNWGLLSVDPDLTGSDKIRNFGVEALVKLRLN